MVTIKFDGSFRFFQARVVPCTCNHFARLSCNFFLVPDWTVAKKQLHLAAAFLPDPARQWKFRVDKISNDVSSLLLASDKRTRRKMSPCAFALLRAIKNKCINEFTRARSDIVARWQRGGGKIKENRQHERRHRSSIPLSYRVFFPWRRRRNACTFNSDDKTTISPIRADEIYTDEARDVDSA